MAGYGSVPSVFQQDPKWTVSLTDCFHGGCRRACYGLCCPHCAMASARTRMDGSDWCFNCCCITFPWVARNIVREGYEIEGTCLGDIVYGSPARVKAGPLSVCAPCAICQVDNESIARGPSHKQPGSNRSPITQPWDTKCTHCSSNLGVCLMGTLLPCALFARARTKFDGSNFLFNLLLSPCLTRSIIGNGYNLESGWWNDCCMVSMCMPCVACQVYYEVDKHGPIDSEYLPAAVKAQPMHR